MREIGVRELKAKLSEVLRSVQAGAPVRITNHGRPIAEILPPRGPQRFEDRLDEMEALGELTRAPHGVPEELPELADGDGSAAELIIEEREASR